jgi:hypothetical protein
VVTAYPRHADGHLIATRCTAYGSHRPEPARFVRHHLLPEALGGATDALNLVDVCDSCHYAIHELLYMLKRSAGDESVWRIAGTTGSHGSLAQRDYARRGWRLAFAAGVQDRIPNEGGVWAA